MKRSRQKTIALTPVPTNPIREITEVNQGEYKNQR